MPVIERSLIAATCLPEWAKPDVKGNLFDSHHASWNPKVYSAPKGVALVIAFVISSFVLETYNDTAF